MTPTADHTRWRRVLHLASLIASCLFLFLLVILLGVVVHRLTDVSARSLPAAALVFELVGVLALCTYACVRLRRATAFKYRSASRLLFFSALALSFIGMVISIGALAQASTKLKVTGSTHNATHLHRVLGASYVFWTFALAAQVIFYWLSWFSPYAMPSPPGSATTEQTTSTFDDLKPQTPMALANLRPGSPSPSPASQPLPTSRQSSRAPRIRDSIQQRIIQPVSSRTRLIRQSSFQSEKPSYQEEPAPITDMADDGFDRWEIDPERADVESPPRAHLPPIPGSRPVSPAKPLDGPFPNYIPAEHASPRQDQDPMFTSPPKRYTSPSRVPGSIRSRSSSVNGQAHIHPLFRTDSPNPPPVASPGTIVTASPWGGQIISDPERAQGFVSRPSSRTSNRSARFHRAPSPWNRPPTMRSVSHQALRSVRSEDTIAGHARTYSRTPPLPDMPTLHRKASMI